MKCGRRNRKNCSWGSHVCGRKLGHSGNHICTVPSEGSMAAPRKKFTSCRFQWANKLQKETKE